MEKGRYVMDRAETQKILSLIGIAYPRFFTGKDKNRAKTLVDIWCRMFFEEDYRTVGSALKAHLATSPYPPAVSDIKLIIDRLANPQITEYEAWNMVSRAAVRGRDLKQRYSELPEEIKGFMSYSDFRDIVYDESPAGVISSNWQRSFKTYQEHRKFERLTGIVKNSDKLVMQGGVTPINALTDQIISQPVALFE